MESLAAIIKEISAFTKDNIVDANLVFDETSSFKELGVDSFSVIQIVLFIERTYNVSMTDKDLTADNLSSIKALAEFTLKCI